MPARIVSRHCTLLLGMLLLPLVLHAAPMNPGQWEMTTTFIIDGKTETAPSGRACITQKDIDDPQKTLPRPAGVCNLTNIQRTADRVTYGLACQDKQVRTRGVANITFNADRYDGTVELMVLGRDDTGVPVAMAINARRLADCAP
ncbi:MAG: DUF3617 family protein [Casimicrobiaceae bacterium]